MPKEKFDLKKLVSDKLIKLLEAEIEKGEDAKWVRSWNISHVVNQNFNSKRVYRGFLNQIFLSFAGYESPYWNTYEGWRECAYKQWAKRNKIKIEDADVQSARSKKKNRFEKHEDWLARQTDNVKQMFDEGWVGVDKGEKGELVTYNARVPNKKYDENNKDSGPEFWWILRYYNVFNSEQTVGCEVPDYKAEENEFTPIECVDKLLEAWENAPEFADDGGNSAHYTPFLDKVSMPKPEKFHTPEAYYHVKLHESVHATGHETRLKREGVVKLDKGNTEGMERYSLEELIAEMGACMLSAHCGLKDEDGDREKNSVAYLRGWIKRLKDDVKLAQSASTKAAAAYDHILGVTYDKPEED